MRACHPASTRVSRSYERAVRASPHSATKMDPPCSTKHAYCPSHVLWKINIARQPRRRGKSERERWQSGATVAMHALSRTHHPRRWNGTKSRENAWHLPQSDDQERPLASTAVPVDLFPAEHRMHVDGCCSTVPKHGARTSLGRGWLTGRANSTWTPICGSVCNREIAKNSVVCHQVEGAGGELSFPVVLVRALLECHFPVAVSELLGRRTAPSLSIMCSVSRAMPSYPVVRLNFSLLYPICARITPGFASDFVAFPVPAGFNVCTLQFS